MKTYEDAKAEMRPEEIVLNELLTKYKILNSNLSEECKDIDADIERLQNTRRLMAEPYLKGIEDIEAQIKLPMLEYQHTFISSSGKINFRKGAVRRTWNLDALDQICEVRKDIKNVIWAFREEKTGEPSISIKLE